MLLLYVISTETIALIKLDFRVFLRHHRVASEVGSWISSMQMELRNSSESIEGGYPTETIVFVELFAD